MTHTAKNTDRIDRDKKELNYIQNDEIKFNQFFLDIFTNEELKDIVANAMVVTENCIIIQTIDYFFELSANVGDKLDIYCDANKNDTQAQLTKDEFIKLYKSSPIMQMEHICIDE